MPLQTHTKINEITLLLWMYGINGKYIRVGIGHMSYNRQMYIQAILLASSQTAFRDGLLD